MSKTFNEQASWMVNEARQDAMRYAPSFEQILQRIIEASEKGSASDAIQDMLCIAEEALVFFKRSPELQKLIDDGIVKGPMASKKDPTPLVFPQGSLVTLKSGGPPMTVEHPSKVSDETNTDGTPYMSNVHVIWFDEQGQLQRNNIAPDLLKQTTIARRSPP